MPGELDTSRRGELLAQYFGADSAARRGGPVELANARDELVALEDQYLELLPQPEISRSPHTGEAFRHSLDAAGLDGLWWRYQNPLRPLGEELPETVVAFTGAVKLDEPVEMFPFLCKPGPEVPFVIPRMLRDESVRAVVSQVQIGQHVGYPIVYFAEDPPGTIQRFNTWGSDRYETYLGWDSVPETSVELDFDLFPWVERGKLLWIAPGDENLVLQLGTDRCPYFDLPGRRGFMRIEGGEVWS
jgi:hypothetical protein